MVFVFSALDTVATAGAGAEGIAAGPAGAGCGTSGAKVTGAGGATAGVVTAVVTS